MFRKVEDHPDLFFDLEQDIGESKNLANQHPDVVSALKEQIADFEKQLGELPKPKM